MDELAAPMGSRIVRNEGRKRGKYGRPCDLCASRRVRCVFHDDSSQCVGCQTQGVKCTNNRVRKKLGPKGLRLTPGVEFFLRLLTAGAPNEDEGLDSLDSRPFRGLASNEEPSDNLLNCFEHRPDNSKALITIDALLPYLQVYQTWFYGYWPVLSVADLMLTMRCNTTNYQLQTIELTKDNAMTYALACSVCAAIATQLSFVSQPSNIDIQTGLPPQVYADEARRVRNLFDYSADPDVVTLLSSFFLYAHYINHKGRTAQAIVYLREAISICQILGFHEPQTYASKSAAEIHRWKKIYYMLLVTERFMCFEDGMPVILESSIELPLLESEEYPGLLAGFTELVKVFSIPDKNFFGEINDKSGYLKMGIFRDSFQGQGIDEKKKCIQRVQDQLVRPMGSHIKISDSQALNIRLSQSWIQAIAWHITSDNGLTRHLDEAHDCFSVDFPLKIARDFLGETSGLPSFAFESNGPGICVKLLEIANSLTFAIHKSSKQYSMAETLEGIFGLVNQFKNDVTLPLNVYHKVASLIASFKNFVPRTLYLPQMHQHATVEELFDDEDGEAVKSNIEHCDYSSHFVQPLEPNKYNYMNSASADEADQYFEAQQVGCGPPTNLVVGPLPGNFIGGQQQHFQLWNKVSILRKISETTLANMFMQNSPSVR